MRVKSDMIENNAFSNETLIRKENLPKHEIRKSVFGRWILSKVTRRKWGKSVLTYFLIENKKQK